MKTYLLSCPTGMSPSPLEHFCSLLLSSGAAEDFPSQIPSPAGFLRSSRGPIDLLVVLAGSSPAKPCTGEPNASTNGFLNG